MLETPPLAAARISSPVPRVVARLGSRRPAETRSRPEARAKREALGRTIQYTPSDRWDAPSAAAGWRNRDVIGHLAAQEVAAAASVAGEPLTELEEFRKSLEAAPFSLDEFNGWTVRRRA